MDVHERLRQLLKERKWTKKKLAQMCGLSKSTLSNIYCRNAVPSITTLKTICDGFGITLSQFFSENDKMELSSQQKELLGEWGRLGPKQREAVLKVMRSMGGN